MTRQWLDTVAYSGLGDRETFEATYDICRTVLERSVPGDFVECGVYAGAQVAVMARAIMDFETDPHFKDYVPGMYPVTHRVHLFDSFAGIPPPGLHDHELAANVGGESACSLADVKANMKRWGVPDELLVYHPGLFQDTVPASTVPFTEYTYVESIAVLRLDGDLYSSTKVCLEHLYPLVSQGGWVIVDDFNLSGCRKAVLEQVVPAPIYWRKPTK